MEAENKHRIEASILHVWYFRVIKILDIFVFSKAVLSALLMKLEWDMNDRRSQFTVMNDILNEIVTFFIEL